MATRTSGTLHSVVATTSTGAGASRAFVPAVSHVTAQVVRGATGGAVTVAIQGSLDGSNWYELVAATASTSTPTVASSVISSTVAPVTYLRANVATHASTGAIDVYLVGR